MPKDDMYRHILLIQLGDIGDVVLTTPAIRAVKETYPGATVSIVVRKPFGSLLAADPHLHEVLELAKGKGPWREKLAQHLRFVSKLRKGRFDLSLDLRTGDRGAILSLLAGAGHRVGRPGEPKQFWRNFIYSQTITQPVYRTQGHPGAEQSLCLLRAIGIDTEDSAPRLYVHPDDRAFSVSLLRGLGLVPQGQWLTLNPFSRWLYKEWSLEKWGEVIDQLWQGRRCATILIGSAEEAAAAARLVQGREAYVFSVAGKTTLGQLSALLSMSALHMGVDSAAPHMATALGTPTLTIHGPSDWRSWRIRDERNQIVTSDLPCCPCSNTGCDNSGRSLCLEQLAAENVIAVADKMLAEFLSKRNDDN